jgi:hypothetical protein
MPAGTSGIAHAGSAACLFAIFALNDRKSDAKGMIGYFAIRAKLSELSREIAVSPTQRTVVGASASVVTQPITEVAAAVRACAVETRRGSCGSF